jgi:HK97 family phage prohead protease
MDLITQKLKLKDINPDFARQISRKWGLSDGVELVRKGLVPEDFKFLPGESASVDYITTKSVDRDGDIVEPAGAHLGDYLKNPVVLWCHDYKKLPIGRNDWIKQTDRGLVAKTIYAVKSNPMARQIYEYRKEGFPLAKSVGFVPLKKKPSAARGVKNHFLEYLVLEYSDCPVPSNPDAIGLAVSKGLLLPSQARQFYYRMDEELIVDGSPIYDDRIDYVYGGE